jgi:hypothetical protein
MTPCPIAPLLKFSIVPVMLPADAAALIRTSIVVEATEPELSGMSRPVL